MRLERWQHLFAKPFQILHKQLVWHRPLVEVQHKGTGAQGTGQLYQGIPHLFW